MRCVSTQTTPAHQAKAYPIPPPPPEPYIQPPEPYIQTDYAHNLFTNKSIGYAMSTDGGRTFAPSPLQIIAGANFSASARRSQCGEGDHGVVRLGDYLYLFFIEWDAPVSLHGGTSVGVARSLVRDGGAPGTWYKYHAGAWASPGVGGDADALAGVPGTSVYALAALPGVLMAVGVMFSGDLNVAYTAGDGLPPTEWSASQAGPLFHAEWSSWERTPNSTELFGYPALVGLAGAAPLPSVGYVYVTYLNAGQDFRSRFLVRRPLELFAGGGASGAPPVALASLALWRAAAPAPALEWPTTGPVTPLSSPATNFTLAAPALAFLATAARPALGLVELVQCRVGEGAAAALALAAECGPARHAAFPGGGARVRGEGWLAPTAAGAEALGWGGAGVAPLGGGSHVALIAEELWRCEGAGAANFSAGVGADGAGCTVRGWAPHVRLGFAPTRRAP